MKGAWHKLNMKWLHESRHDPDAGTMMIMIPSLGRWWSRYSLRADADAIALEIRLHNKELHKRYCKNNNSFKKIFDVVEKSRIEAQGSKIFKGIKNNIYKKHNFDIDNSNHNTDSEKLIDAFKYVSFVELSNQKLDGKYQEYEKLLKAKLADSIASLVSFFPHFGTTPIVSWVAGLSTSIVSPL